MKRELVVVAAITVMCLTGCSGSCGSGGGFPFSDVPDFDRDVPTVDGLSTGDRAWKKIRLADNEAKPFEPVALENLPEGVSEGDLIAEVYAVEKFEGVQNPFSGPVTQASGDIYAPGSEGELSWIPPMMPTTESTELEVVITDGDHASERLTLTLQSPEARTGAYADARDDLVATVETMVERSQLSASDLRERIHGDVELETKWLPLALAYNLVVDPENPKSLVNREVSGETQKLLDAFATRTELGTLASKARKSLPPPLETMGGGGGQGGGELGFEPVTINGPSDLEKRLDEYAKLKSKIAEFQARKTAFTVFTAIATAPIAGAGGAAAKGIGAMLSVLGINMTAYEYMESTKLGQLPCCLITTDADIEGSEGSRVNLKEDEEIPQLTVNAVETTARSIGMNFSDKTLNAVASLIADKVGGKIGEGLGNFASSLGGKSAADFAGSVATKLANKAGKAGVDVVDGSSKISFEWNVEIYPPAAKYVRGVEEAAGQSARLITDASGLQWKLDPNTAYDDAGPTWLTLMPNPDVFWQPVGPSKYPKAKRLVRLQPIDVQFVPQIDTFETGEERPMAVQVRHSEDTELADVTMSPNAGEVVSYDDDWDNYDSPIHHFTWKAPEKKEDFPVTLTTKSKSDEGLRGEVDNPPERTGKAKILNNGRVDFGPPPCLEFGETHEFDPQVAPRDAEVVWSASAGSLQPSEDTQSATYRAPNSPAEVEITAHHKGDDSTSDSITVPVRETCVCTYRVHVAGFVSHSYMKGGDGGDKPISGMAYEDKGLFSAGYSKDRVAQVQAKDLSRSQLTGDSATFPGSFVYVESGASVEAGSDRAIIEVDWRGEDAMSAKITASGPATACRDCGSDATGRSTRFSLTMYAPMWRFKEDGTITFMNCEGEVQEVDPGEAPTPGDVELPNLDF